MTNLRNEITRFQQRFDESFYEAWDRFNDLLRACPHHGFSELHQLDTFYNALNVNDQDSLNSAAGVVAKVSTSSSTPAISSEVAKLKGIVRALLLDKKTQSSAPAHSPTPAPIKAVEPNCVTCGGSGTLPNNTITNPKEDLKSISTRSGVAYQGPRIPTPEPIVSPVSASMPNLKPSIPYPLRRDNERRRDQDNEQIEKFYEIFKDMSFEISFTDALILMPKFASTIKALIGNKEKLSEMARTPMNEHCLAVILNKLPRKLGDPGKFLIPCEFPGMDECLALADHGASINLMPLSVWEGLSLPELTPTCMTLELTDRSVSKPIGIAKDVSVKVGVFHFPVDFVVVDFEPDPRVPLILERDSDFLLFEEADAFLGLEDDPNSLKINPFYYDPKGDILLLETILNSEPLPPLLEYAFLEGDNRFPIIIAKELGDEEKSALIKVLKSHNPWVSLVHCVPKKGGFTVVKNEENELIPTHLVTEWRVCIDYRKLNEATRKDHFPLPFMDQILERLAGNEYYCFLDGFSGYFQIPIDPRDQEKTTFTCPYRAFGYRRIPFGVCNAPGTFQRCMLAIFHDMVEKTMEVFMDDFSKKLTEAPILIAPNWDLPFELMCDASDFAIGAVVGKRHEKHFRPIHYASKMMTDAESNYTTTEKEMLAVVYAFEKFWSYLIMNKIIVHTDHSALKYLFAKKDAKARLLRWVLLLQEFDFKFRNTKGAENLSVDHLASWFADFANYHAGNFIVKAIDYLSKWVEVKALPTNDARVVCKFLKSLFARFGAPRAIISDRGTYFCNDQFAKVMLKYRVTHRLSIAYHPQTSGQVEKVQLNELNELRDHAYENSLIYKEKTKKIDDFKIKNRVFNVGDRVLLFNSRLKIFSGKLKTRWSGPFTITNFFPYGTVELSQANGPDFKVNGHRVKHYFGGDVPQLDCPNCEVSHALNFVLHSQELHILSFILGIQYPNLID
nr:DNA-directed DNA polymerase [Tanacetum cinerariifolium]